MEISKIDLFILDLQHNFLFQSPKLSRTFFNSLVERKMTSNIFINTPDAHVSTLKRLNFTFELHRLKSLLLGSVARKVNITSNGK